MPFVSFQENGKGTLMFSERGRFVSLNPYVCHENALHNCETYSCLAEAPETFSQCGEDIIVDGLLGALKCRKASLDNCVYVDIGANHPIQLNNTFRLYQEGMRGIAFEPDTSAAEEYKRVRPEDRIVNAAVSASTEKAIDFYKAENSQCSSASPEHGKEWDAEKTSVANVCASTLSEYVPEGNGVCLLSLDAEGFDMEILKAIDWRAFRPWVVIAEPFSWVDTGKVMTEMVLFMRDRGYAFIAMTRAVGCNAIFMDKGWLANA